ncbi:MAG: hypothetical protein ABEI97_03685 [Candidatus Nanohaloarchaea archaeon]
MAVERQGQIFIVGTILFASLVVGTVFLTQTGSISSTVADTPKILFDTATDEFPRMLNLAAAENDSVRHVRSRLVSYMAFHRSVVERHGAAAVSHALITVPNSTGVSAVVANFRGQEMNDVEVSVDGTTASIGTVPDGEARIRTFTGVSDQFRANLSFTAGETFDHSISASKSRITALYRLTIDGVDQTWRGTETY